MLMKILGAVLLVAGVVLAFPLLGGLVVGTLVLGTFLLKLVLVGGLVFWGWRWINRGGTGAKIAGAFLLVGGIALAFPLFGSLVMGVFGAFVFLLKLALVIGLVYWGWCWISDRRPSWPKRNQI